MLRSLRKQQETLCKKLSKLGFATPADPWAEGSKLVQVREKGRKLFLNLMIFV